MKKKVSFSLKIWIFNMSILCLAILIMFSVFIAAYLDAKNREMEGDIKNELNSIMNTIVNELEVLKTVALQVGTNGHIAKELDNAEVEPKNYFDTNLDVRESFYKILWSYILDRTKVSRICIYNDAKDFVFVGDALNINEEYINHQYISETFKIHDEILDFFYITSERASFVRKIKMDPTYGGDVVGYVEVEIDLELWKKALLENVQSENGLYIYNTEDDKILFGMEPEGIQESNEIISVKELKDVYKEGFYVSYDNIDLYHIGIYSVKNLNQQKEMINIFLVSAALIVLVIMVMMALLQKMMMDRMTKPLLNLCENVRNIKLDEDINETLISEPDEFELISGALKRMVISLKCTMDKNIEIKTAEIKAQLFALQAQMNPHFIHNTLNIIQAYAQEGNCNMTAKICEALSDMIRYSSEYSKDKVFLRNEIEHMETYMELVKIRYEDGILYELDNKIPLGKIKVPRFILQPLVENSLTHGLIKKEFPWEIKVKCYIEGKHWIVNIYDNGGGFSPDVLEDLEQFRKKLMDGNESIINKNLKLGGLGIKNIMIRLYLEYGEEMIFKVDSTIDEYTNTSIGGILSEEEKNV